MKRILVATISIVTLAGSAAAAVYTSEPRAPVVEQGAGQTLSDRIRRAVATARGGPQAAGANVEAAAFAAIETVIVDSGSDPVSVLTALGTASAEEGCQIQADGLWSFAGCAALAQMSELVQTALGGPAAGRDTGAIAGPAGGAPPPTSLGSDYVGN